MPDATRSPAGPATFRDVFGQPEYRAVYAATVLSWVGDYMTKAAVSVLVYQQTKSVALSAASFAISYLPWLVGGPLLATLAERRSYRNVMVFCDALRMCLIIILAIPGMPIPVMMALLFAITLANPPSQAARSALLPLILTGDRLVLGISLNLTTGQAAQVVGYVAGAGIGVVNPRLALLIDAVTFAASALIIRFGVRWRPPAMRSEDRSHLLQETAAGFRLVFGTPVLRAIAIIVFTSMLFAIVPEGLAAAWASERVGDSAQRGVAQALIMAASPVGFILGGLIIGRLVPPATRQALIRPFAILAPLVLVPALFDPPPAVVSLLAALCGFAVAGVMPAANALFVQALPNGFRARAFGVMGSGTQAVQGIAVITTGLIADRFSIPLVVGVWSLAGVLLMLLAMIPWPSQGQIEAAIADAAAQNSMSVAPPAAKAPESAMVDVGADAPAASPAGAGNAR
ncbi:MAG TPA: MFS transporter [Micromonosporaceae bacterium]|nr:MFS transporter [Micromonosporaceae bacterium]